MSTSLREKVPEPVRQLGPGLVGCPLLLELVRVDGEDDVGVLVAIAFETVTGSRPSRISIEP
jgi:hypothetical protein